MDVAEVYLELYGRVPSLVHEVLDGLSRDDLLARPAAGANPIGWLLWHLTRVQDDHVADVMGVDQLWASGEWAASFGLEPDTWSGYHNMGYGHTTADVDRVQPAGAAAIAAYHDAVDARTRTYLASLTPADLDRVVDRSWDPPVTLGVRLVSVADDSLQHVGQAAYLKGLLADAPLPRP